MLVQAFLENSADRLPGKIALICGGQRLTYSEVETRANRLANALQARGLRRGERVVIYLPNSVELVVSVFAALKAGGVFVVVNHTTKHDKLAYILNNCQASALVTSGHQADLARQLVQEAPSCRIVTLMSPPAPAVELFDYLALPAIESEFSPERPSRVNVDLDLACLIYTSDSTGDPKRVMSDHSNMAFAASSIIEYLQNREDDIIIDVLPLSFDYGLYQLLMAFKLGGTLAGLYPFPYELWAKIASFPSSNG
jgi:long-chain acyl-CoA synthetase